MFGSYTLRMLLLLLPLLFLLCSLLVGWLAGWLCGVFPTLALILFGLSVKVALLV